MRIVQGQNVGQSNQCSYSLHLLEQRNFGIHFLGDLLDAPIVFRDALVQRILNLTFGVVIFFIVIQGLTIKPLVRVLKLANGDDAFGSNSHGR